MFIELHFIQNFAPSNLNRDDTNNPKDCTFGGVRRARISSQAVKRAMRTSPIFGQKAGVPSSQRTKLITGRLADMLAEAGMPTDEAAEIAKDMIAAAFAKPDKKDATKTNVLVFVSDDEIRLMAEFVLDARQNAQPLDEKAVKSKINKLLKDRALAPDIALFGRMLADNPLVNVDAACQVAHAISTHRVNMDIDFFTAVDDLQSEEQSGAGMMGLTGFNSATFYRYIRLDWNQLCKNLYNDTAAAQRALEGLLYAAVEALPTGKQNSFAAHNPPSFLLGVVRQNGMGWSLANAFEKPVQAGSGGLVLPSVKALDAYWGRLVQVYGFEGQAFALAIDDAVDLETLAGYQVHTFSDWAQGLVQAVTPQQGG